MEAKWLDKQDVLGPFKGVLVVMNIGKDNYRAIPGMSEAYLESIVIAASKAHADGLVVVYVFDNEISYSIPPYEVEFMDESDQLRHSGLYGMNRLDFSSDLSIRNNQTISLLQNVLGDRALSFENTNSRIGGYCSIDGEEVLMPVYNVGRIQPNR